MLDCMLTFNPSSPAQKHDLPNTLRTSNFPNTPSPDAHLRLLPPSLPAQIEPWISELYGQT